MQNNRPFSPTHRPSGILPPLSKYYYGPAVSPDRSPAQDTGWDTPNPQGAPALLPRRLSPNPASAPPLSQWAPYQNGLPQQQTRIFPGPPSTAPPAHPVAQSSYNPNTYGPMPGARLSPINPTWNQSSPSVASPDTSKWGVHYQQVQAKLSQTQLKPPLPPRAPSGQGHHAPLQDNGLHQSQQHGSHEFLRPIAYSPVPSPSIPQGFTPPNVEQFQNTPSQLEPHRLPPPPPRKIPIHKEDAEGQEPTSLSTQTDESGGTSQSPGQREGSEMHTIGDNFNLLKKPVEVPPAVTAEPHNGDGYSVHGRRVDAGESDGESPTEQATRSGHAGDISYDNGNSSEGFAPPDVHRQSEERPLMTSTEPERTAPNAQDWGHITNSSNNQIQRDDSFYWHSPHSSASVSHDLDQNQDVPGMSSLLDATPEPQEKHITAPPATQEPFGTSEQTTSMYQSTIGSYGASALGFGGPSDWEHFGDYDGEEVDDTDLYIRPKSPVKSNAAADTCNTPELPGDVVPVDIQPEQHPTTVAKPRRSSTLAAVQPILSDSIATIEARSNEAHHDGFAERDLKESFDNLAQPSASDKQGPTSSSAVEQEFVAVQQSASKSIPTTFPPQFPYEREQQQPKSSKHAANGAVMDRHNTQAAILEGSEQPSPDSQSGNSSGVGATEVHSAEYAVPENESLAERTVPRSDGAAYDDVQQPLNEHFVAQSGHEDKPRLENGAPSAGCHEMSRENAAKQESVVSDGSVLPKIKELRDPYADLDPWEKASLNRYVAMLHEESQASTDAEKLNMFKAFVRKEWKLRAILYGADDDLGDDFALATKNPPVSRTNTLPLPSPVSKALPALPPDANQPEAEATQAKSQLSNKMHKPSLASLMTTKGHGPAPRTSVENSYVIVETRGGERQQHSGEDVLERYSPGGRPIPPQARNVRKPITSVGPNEHSFSPDTPRSSTSGTQVSHDKPAYTPFRYSQGYVDDAEQPVDRRTSFRPYAAMKLEPIESEPDSAPELVTGIPHHRSLPATADDRQTLISIFSSQTQSSTQRSSTDAETQSLSIADQNPPLDLRRFERADFDPLIAVLPQSGHIPSDAVELSNLQHGTNAIPDDFSFIHQQVVAWDTKAKKIRADHEKERQIRQGESEQRIDALFNDDEIGYGDISELESGFKRAEAARKTEEDRAEYQTFVEEVFNAVWKRLHYEIDQLSPLYDQYSSLAHGTLAGKDMFEATQGQYALAPMMSALLTLHQKLEIRHQKAFEAVLERDRRLKKTEVAQFYTLGNVTEVKQLEKQFESAEKKAIAEYCKQRNARANRLMDVLDQNTLRGVGANQDYMEAVMKAVRRIAAGRAFASAPASEPGIGLDEVVKAKTVTALLASSSEQIVQTFHVADMLLNAADYELSVATARLANADPTTFERLKEERAEEDAKLMRDLQHRLALIREDSRRTNDEIVKLLCFLGVQGGHAEAGPMPKSPPVADGDHEQRLQKALEEAKRRNAKKAAGDGLP